MSNALAPNVHGVISCGASRPACQVCGLGHLSASEQRGLEAMTNELKDSISKGVDFVAKRK